MPPFEHVYSEKDFLDALSEGFCTIGGMKKKVGCARMTVITYITELVKAGKVEKIPVDGGQLYVYRKKE